VSRGTVREAVQFLEALGLLEVRHGSGTVVSHRSEDRQALRRVWQSWTARNVGRVRELLEVRRGLDLFAAELASRRRVPDALQTMADALAQLRGSMRDDDVTAGVQADVLFHRAIGEATGNVALIELIESIGEQLMQERAALLSQPTRPQQSLDEHSAIYDAIRAGDPERARAAALAHLESVEKGIDELAVKP
jgi:GntR family transcriptional repressor for pyruvate dehydrogenase complex